MAKLDILFMRQFMFNGYKKLNVAIVILMLRTGYKIIGAATAVYTSIRLTANGIPPPVSVSAGIMCGVVWPVVLAVRRY